MIPVSLFEHTKFSFQGKPRNFQLTFSSSCERHCAGLQGLQRDKNSLFSVFKVEERMCWCEKKIQLNNKKLRHNEDTCHLASPGVCQTHPLLKAVYDICERCYFRCYLFYHISIHYRDRIKVNLSFIVVLLTKYYWLQRRVSALSEKPSSGGFCWCLNELCGNIGSDLFHNCIIQGCIGIQ